MKKIIWFTSGIIFLTGFFIIAPLMKVLHWQGSDLAFLIFAGVGFVFIPLTLSILFKKFK